MSSLSAGHHVHARPAGLGWAVVRGFVLVLPAVILLNFGLSYVMDVQATQDQPGIFILHHGIWATAADLFFWSLLVAAAGWSIAASVRAKTDLPVSAFAVIAALAISSAPLLFFPSPAFLLVLVLGTLWLVPRFAVGRQRRMPIPRLVPVGLFLAGTVVAGGYIVSHPLIQNGGGGGAAGRVSFGMLQLSNGSFGDLTILSVSGANARAGKDGPVSSLPPVRELRIPARAARWITVTGCSSSVLSVRYRLFGRTWTQPVAATGVTGCPAEG